MRGGALGDLKWMMGKSTALKVGGVKGKGVKGEKNGCGKKNQVKKMIIMRSKAIEKVKIARKTS